MQKHLSLTACPNRESFMRFVPIVLFVLCFGFPTTGLWTPAFAAEGQMHTQSGQYVVTKDTVKGFLKLFREAKKVADSGPQVAVVKEAEAYIKSCCNSIESAVALLEQAGFKKFRYIDDPSKVSELNRSYLVSHGQTYDKFIACERSVGWWLPPFFWPTEYSVGLLIRNNQIEGVSAQVSMEIL